MPLLSCAISSIRFAAIGLKRLASLIFISHGLECPGIYILLSGEEQSQPAAYIGESGDNVGKRLRQHADKDWWKDTIVIFSPTHGELHETKTKYVESLLITKAREHKSGWKLENKQQSAEKNSLRKTEQKRLQTFAASAEGVLQALGCNLFRDLGTAALKMAEPPARNAVLSPSTSPYENKSRELPRPHSEGRGATIFAATSSPGGDGGGYDARMEVRGRKTFVVLAGSKIRLKEGPSLPPNLAQLRRKLKKDEKEGVLVLEKDETLASISATAKYVLGSSHSGRGLWKSPDGGYYEDWAARHDS